MDIKKIIKENALVITSVFAAFSAVISFVNLLSTSSIAPVIKRVEALEEWKEEIKPDIKEITVISTKLDTIKEDIKDIKSVLGIR